MQFDKLDTEAGLKQLDKYLEERSYIEGWTPSSADVAVSSSIPSAPDAKKFVNVARWYHHIASFSNTEKAAFPQSAATPSAAPKPATEKKEEKKDDDFDLFGDVTEEEKKAKEDADKKKAEEAKKKKAAAKSRVVFDVKPFDDETDLGELEKMIRGIEMEGLFWGNSQLVPIAFGIKKIQIVAIIVDELVSTDVLEEKLMEFEDSVQSVDIVSFNKL